MESTETMTVYVQTYDFFKKRSDELLALEAGTHEKNAIINKELRKHLHMRNNEFGDLLSGEHDELVCIFGDRYKELCAIEEWYRHLEAHGIDNAEAYQCACETWDCIDHS